VNFISDDEKNKQTAIKLDEVMRLLFEMSTTVLVGMINSLFNENFDPKRVEVKRDNAKFVNESLEVIEGDIFFRVTDPSLSNRTNKFHIELQTFSDGSMAIRMLNYDLAKAIEDYRFVSDEGEFPD
jgi:hypothetical protein